MNAPPKSSPADRTLDDEAVAWLCEREEGFSPARAQAFATWLAGDRRHQAAVDRVGRAMSFLEQMPTVRDELEKGDVRPCELPTRESRGILLRFPTRRWMTGLAAALIIGLGGWWATQGTTRLEERDVTAADAPRRIALPDGSVIDLNAASRLRIQFSSSQRKVDLDAGEAHFQVARDASRPFTVLAGGVVVRAVGTAFNVRLAEKSVDVLVVEGKVEVTSKDTPSGAQAPGVPPQLEAGQRVVVTPDSAAVPTVQMLPPASIRAMLAWQDPVTTFVDLPLREIVLRFNRRNATQLVIADAALGERKIGGVFALNQVDVFVRLLEQDGDIVSERRGGNEIVLRGAP